MVFWTWLSCTNCEVNFFPRAFRADEKVSSKTCNRRVRQVVDDRSRHSPITGDLSYSCSRHRWLRSGHARLLCEEAYNANVDRGLRELSFFSPYHCTPDPFTSSDEVFIPFKSLDVVCEYLGIKSVSDRIHLIQQIGKYEVHS